MGSKNTSEVCIMNKLLDFIFPLKTSDSIKIKYTLLIIVAKSKAVNVRVLKDAAILYNIR